MYTVDPNADEPIMLLNKQIGMTCNDAGEWDGEPYIDGALFQEELMQLDTLGKKKIKVWINSGGGSIIHAMNIFSAITKSKTPVDTYNMGVCASAAGAIFMAGRKRYMCDYSQFMMHPVSGAEDMKAMNAFKESCVAMLSAKSDLHPDMISYMMDTTTWIGLDDCLKNGIATDADYTVDSNKKYMPSNNVKEMYAYSNNILQQTILNLKPIKMDFKNITNKLKLVEGANESTILSAINQLETDVATANTALGEATSKVDELTAELEKATNELKVAKEATELAEKQATEVKVEAEATEMVNSFKTKIGNDATVLAKWVNKAKLDLAGTKELLESIPLNKVGNRIEMGADNAPKKVTVQSIMQEVQNRLNSKK